jgi:hypothetical protein
MSVDIIVFIVDIIKVFVNNLTLPFFKMPKKEKGTNPKLIG